MSLAEQVESARRDAVLYRAGDRDVIEVRGEDRVRWLDGMISGDVAALESGPSGSGCAALLLTNRGAIVADLHVGRLGDAFLLETRGSETLKVREALDRFIIADDVTLEVWGEAIVGFGLEGPRALAILGLAIGEDLDLQPECWTERRIADRSVRIAAFGWSGERAFRIFAAAEEAEAVEAAIESAGRDQGLARADGEAIEVLRVEAGIPMLGAELDEEVLPPEARLENAIATQKGCYVGQEIVARLRARGQVNHLLVGLRVEGEAMPLVGSRLRAEGRETGEITSAVRSPGEGLIALGYVRREHAEPGTQVEFEGGAARVAALPFVSLPSLGRDSGGDAAADSS